MKIFLFFFAFFISIACGDGIFKKLKKSNKMRKTDEFDNLRRDIENINILSVAYELTYDANSVIKVVLKCLDDLEHSISFFALLRVEDSAKSYKLKCSNISISVIECYSEKNVRLNPQDKHYFYYKNNGQLTLDEKEVMQDFKKVTLIFKPEMYEDQIMWKDHRKVLGLNHRKIVGGGYLYLVPKRKKLLHKTKDGFNQYIELNNFISHAGFKNQISQGTLGGFKEAIRRGFHIVDADLQFTKDKVPVIIPTTNLEKVSDGKGKVFKTTLKELQQLDFGSKFDEKYAGETILTFEELLKLCKENKVIIDLNLGLLNFKKYFEETDEYIKIILDTVEKQDMFDSIFFNDGPNPNTVLKLKQFRNDISVSISNMNGKDHLEKLKSIYAGSKRIIYSFSDLSKGKIDEEKLKFALSTGNKIKATTIDDLELANKLQSMGVNFITTNKLHPFLIKNDYQIPIMMKCTQFDILADCRLGPEVKLIDNEIYNIYYSENIYNLYEDIVDQPIGEFKYLDTKKLDDLYYTVPIFDFEASYIKINSSIKVDKGLKLKGKVGPAHENVEDCYLYDFVCEGNNKYKTHCKILKNDTIVPYEGNYTVHTVVNYSQYIQPNVTIENTFLGINLDKNKGIFYYPIIIFVVITIFIIIFSLRKKQNNYRLKEINIGDSAYVPETTELNSK